MPDHGEGGGGLGKHSISRLLKGMVEWKWLTSYPGHPLGLEIVGGWFCAALGWKTWCRSFQIQKESKDEENA